MVIGNFWSSPKFLVFMILLNLMDLLFLIMLRWNFTAAETPQRS